MTATTPSACIACGRGPDDIPLIPLDYQGARLWICPQHLPVLIHDPTQLTGRLAGAEHMRPADHHD
ncbi:MAG: hypothetical protein OER21_02075 [Gemmatimonadota bacterium]|nr:hypothetical protein [Gemmatimonadota bacterium]